MGLVKRSGVYFFILIFVFLEMTGAEQVYVDVPPRVTALLVEKTKMCIAETGADVGILQRVFEWQYDDTDTSKRFAFCLYRNSGLTDENGRFYEDKVMASHAYSNLKDGIIKAVRECNNFVERNAAETVHKALRCFAVKTPVLLRFKAD